MKRQRNRNGRRVKALGAVTAVGLALAACKGSGGDGNAVPAKDALDKASGVTHVAFGTR